MHNSVKIAALFLLSLCVLASCGKGVRIETTDKSYTTDTIFVDAKIPKIVGLGSKPLEESINEEYEEVLEDLLEDFSENARKTGDKSTFTIETTEHYNKNGFFSVVTQVDSCTKNTHKSCQRITKNIDTRLSKEVCLSELFEGDSYIDMINARILEAVEEDSEKFSGLWEKPKLSENQDFYIDADNLVLCYPPYELSYYERGYVEIPLSLNDMSGYLKSEYQNLVKNVR